MMHLREIQGQQQPQNSTNASVKLDEQVVSPEELERRQQDKSVRIVEVGENSFKTLKHLKG